MSQTHSGRKWTTDYRRHGLTVIELLTVIGIISVCFAIVASAVSGAKHAASVSKCLSNLRQIAMTGAAYSRDQVDLDGSSGPTLPWHLGFQQGGLSCSFVSEFVYGGFQTNVSVPEWPDDADWRVYPTNIRPFNKYIAPGRQRGTVEAYICPSDDSIPLYPVMGEPPRQGSGSHSSWEVFGNSYPINWHWYQDARWSVCGDYSDISVMSRHGSQVLQIKVGGPAARFVVFMEGAMNGYMAEARPPDGSQGQSSLQQLGYGWHRKYSTYTMAMWDGHAEYRYVDTRYAWDSRFSVWAEPNTPVWCP